MFWRMLLSLHGSGPQRASGASLRHEGGEGMDLDIA